MTKKFFKNAAFLNGGGDWTMNAKIQMGNLLFIEYRFGININTFFNEIK